MRVFKSYDLGPDPPKTVIVNIGDWDMDTVPALDVDVGIAYTRWRSIEVLIRADTTGTRRKLDFNGDASGRAEHTHGKGVTIMTLYAGVGGYFDDVEYDAGDFNRGFITIGYI